MFDKLKSNKFLINLILSILAVVLALTLLEVGLRLYDLIQGSSPFGVDKTKAEVPLYLICDCPFVYQLNPNHPEISTQGIRDQDYVIPKNGDDFRVLVLGDSVTYGFKVPPDRSFPNLLEELTNQRYGKVEVINAGVTAYTPYNELQYYLHKGKDFQPNVVVIAFVMNDVVDPALHWNYTKQAIPNIPEEAIPNIDYHRNHIRPILEARKDRPLRLERFLRFRFYRLWLYLAGFFNGEAEEDPWPTFLTGEDSLSIKVLLDYDSAEWQWLRSMYDQLNVSVLSNDAIFVIMIFPLAYQLAEDYPYLPQTLMNRYCEERTIHCLDLLPLFRAHGTENLYLEDDVWHLSERGHELVAKELAKYLAEQHLLPRK